jgi:hypothetical protein
MAAILGLLTIVIVLALAWSKSLLVVILGLMMWARPTPRE